MPTKKKINLLTIGFTRKTAENFFELLIQNGVKKVIDVRLNNISQLAGFSKKPDLAYFLDKIAKIEYVHGLELAPTAEILTKYKKNKGDWSIYEQEFLQLIKERQIETKLSPELLDNACLLCSEAQPHYCHRRLVAEYLQQHWGNINLIHL